MLGELTQRSIFQTATTLPVLTPSTISARSRGGYTDNNNHGSGFLYDAGTYTTINVPNSVYTIAVAINASGQIANASGQIAGYYEINGGYGYGLLYSGGTYTTIGFPNRAGRHQGDRSMMRPTQQYSDRARGEGEACPSGSSTDQDMLKSSSTATDFVTGTAT